MNDKELQADEALLRKWISDIEDEIRRAAKGQRPKGMKEEFFLQSIKALEARRDRLKRYLKYIS